MVGRTLMGRHGCARPPAGSLRCVRVCASCRESLLAGRVPPSSKSHGFACPLPPADLPDRNPVEERLISPRLPFMSIRWLTRRNEKYYHSKLEEENRFAIFVRNLELIIDHNKRYKEGNVSFKLAMNRFGDVLQSEVRQAPAVKPRRRFTLKLPCTDTPDGLNVSDLPAEVDWRKEGAVTPVPDQGSCLSSYAFSATGALESQWFRKTGKLVPLSAQNIVDCGAMFHNRNCDGGFMDSTYGYIKVNGGIDSEESYPYVGTKSDCAFDPSGVAATVSSFVNINSATESTLMTKVALVGPVCAFVDNSQSTFTFYSEGVYHDSGCLKDSMHQAVLIVGYGATKDGQKYWIVRNSWGTNWGQDGYILIRRDSHNECGIASFITYPVI